MCLRGVRELQKEWLAKEPSSDLAVYVVWSTQLGASESRVPDATALMPDARARHYWDPGLAVGKAVSGQLGLDDPAWDVWLLYDRVKTWGRGGPPEPDWWEHQLGNLPAERRLDPQRFAQRAAELLERGPRIPDPGRH